MEIWIGFNVFLSMLCVRLRLFQWYWNLRIYFFLQKGLKNVFDEAILAALEPPEQTKKRKCRILWFAYHWQTELALTTIEDLHVIRRKLLYQNCLLPHFIQQCPLQEECFVIIARKSCAWIYFFLNNKRFTRYASEVHDDLNKCDWINDCNLFRI